MIFLIAVIMGSLLGFAWKGQIKNISEISLRGAWLLFAYFVIDFFLNSKYSVVIAAESNRVWVLSLLAIQYASITILALMNINKWPLIIIAIGEILNAIVILLNNGRMPVNIAEHPHNAKYEQLINNSIPHYEAMSDNTIFPLLGDIVKVNIISPSMISVGDIIIAIGLLMFSFYILTYHKYKHAGTITINDINESR